MELVRIYFKLFNKIAILPISLHFFYVFSLNIVLLDPDPQKGKLMLIRMMIQIYRRPEMIKS